MEAKSLTEILFDYCQQLLLFSPKLSRLTHPFLLTEDTWKQDENKNELLTY